MKIPRITRKFRLSAGLICAGIAVLCLSPWAGAAAGATDHKLRYHETQQKSVYAAVTTTEVSYRNVNNPRGLAVMSSGIALSTILIFSGIFFYNRTRREELTVEMEQGSVVHSRWR